ncbi:hypothetical protein DFW101_3550 [Solidesulfovibrio carbinoliphilus subsp. oakridgensis]|uniref:Uncharacterized protein n=1 Tax=Solidesulfovibrio carbinoliphilus subsp. oakridgensis TaxID=694327 RepID=G7QCA0_9BACT|nr:hypothetical protein [Solidesulfovibrio carbinoliphilus]EHJ49546.1 hypothetical protein DFW101_3550 [Solidesulfovibrio carbinoliphilus subsp. oakridgensis]
MQTLNVSVEKDAAGLLVTIVCVDRAAAHFRRFRRPTGTSRAEIVREAERMALERWPGGIMWRLALPLGDCGHVE